MRVNLTQNVKYKLVKFMTLHIGQSFDWVVYQHSSFCLLATDSLEDRCSSSSLWCYGTGTDMALFGDIHSHLCVRNVNNINTR